MKGRKIAGIIIFIVGILLIIVSALADVIGIGGQASFGFKQIGGTALGAVLTVVGAILAFKK